MVTEAYLIGSWTTFERQCYKRVLAFKNIFRHILALPWAGTATQHLVAAACRKCDSSTAVALSYAGSLRRLELVATD